MSKLEDYATKYKTTRMERRIVNISGGRVALRSPDAICHPRTRNAAGADATAHERVGAARGAERQRSHLV